MKQIKSLVGAVAVLGAAHALADLGLVYSDGRLASVFQEGDRIQYRVCHPGQIGSLTRRCKGATQPNFARDRKTFQSNLKALFRIPMAYQVTDGLERLLQEKEYYTQLLAKDPDSETTHRKSHDRLAAIQPLERVLLTAHKGILENLADGRDRTIEQDYEKGEFLNLIYTFYTIWFDGERPWILGSPGADFDHAEKKVCSLPWRLITLADLDRAPSGTPNREAVLNSPLGVQPGFSVWLNNGRIHPSVHNGNSTRWSMHDPYSACVGKLGPLPVGPRRWYKGMDREEYLEIPVSSSYAVLCIWD
ncbi:MAG: hypothetical protein HYZ71_01960 [Deltaproteobacteria bacterium]|nr:hypothetical protein [Deltaproteobacteria bacterium]